MSLVKANTYQDATGGSNAVFSGVASPPNSMGFRNRIINGDMRIDQRNAGAAVTANEALPVDRFKLAFGNSAGAFSGQQTTTAPAGFVNSLKYTTTTADASLGATEYATLYQVIEGLNVADLAWGTASAATVTLSFWCRSSQTGTFGGSLRNSANNRSYPFSYSISVANTWEQKSVTIAGDTSGTWLTTNGAGVYVNWSMGAGSTLSGTAGAWTAANYIGVTGAVNLIATLNADFYITGVQFEAGTVASPFERVDYGRQLIQCQRYYYKQQATGVSSYFGVGYVSSATLAVGQTIFPTSMRTAPTALEQNGTAGDYRTASGAGVVVCSSVPAFNSADVWGAQTNFTVASGLTAGHGVLLRSTNSNAYLGWSAEL
jgi:hypothetical protein